MKKQKWMLISFLLFCSIMFAQANYRADIYKAYISKDMGKWKLLIDQMGKETGKTNAFVLEWINYQYGYIGWCLGTDRNQEAVKYLKSAESNVEYLIARSYKPSHINAYKAAFYGFRISLSKIKAPIFGPKSLSCCELAMKQDKTNPLGFLQYGNALYYMPKLFGGSKTEAMAYYLKAEKLMEAQPDNIQGDWNYLNLLALIGMGYQETGHMDLAGKYFAKALQVEPQFTWIKKELIPALKKHEK